MEKRGFISQTLEGEKSWKYVPPRSFSWVGGTSPITWDWLTSDASDDDNNTEENKPEGDVDSSQGGNWWDGFWPPKHPLEGWYSTQ